MKKENFVDGGTVDQNWLEELVEKLKGMIQDHNDAMDCHENLMTAVHMAIELHSRGGVLDGEVGEHALPGERQKWNDAADAVKELAIAKGDIREAKEARNAAEKARSAAEDAEEDAKECYLKANREANRAQEQAGLSANGNSSAQAAATRADESAVRAEAAKTMAENAVVSARCEADRAADAVNGVSEEVKALYQYVEDGINEAMSAAGSKAEQVAFERLKDEVSGKASAGKTVASMDALEALPLPGDVSEGVVYHVLGGVKSDKPTVLVEGKFGDLFSGSDGYYEFKSKILQYSQYMAQSENGYLGRIYGVDGEYLFTIAYGLPVLNDATKLHGYYGSDTDVVSFYMSSHSDTVIEAVSRKSLYYNGAEWVELAMAENVGKIDEALDAILKMDADILGGDA